MKERTNWLKEILGGEFLLKEGVKKRLRYVAFLFLLTLLYISFNFVIEQSLRREGSNKRELKELNSIYLTKSAILQYNSTREEVEKRLEQMGSSLKPLRDPPLRIKLER
ncbi:MAG: FtsL-like putative cell division protein [Bacteroidales bacterium]